MFHASKEQLDQISKKADYTLFNETVLNSTIVEIKKYEKILAWINAGIEQKQIIKFLENEIRDLSEYVNDMLSE